MPVAVIHRQFHGQQVASVFDGRHHNIQPFPLYLTRPRNKGVLRDHKVSRLQRFEQPELHRLTVHDCLVLVDARPDGILPHSVTVAHCRVEPEKSYELAAKYMGQNGQDGATVQTPATVQNGNGLGQPAVAVQAARERTVSGLQQPLSDAEFMRRYSQPRNYGFNTAVGTGYAMGRNTIAACIHQDQTLTDGQAVKLRLLEPMQAGNIVVPKNTLVAGTAKVQGERLDILVSSIEYAGNIIPVELAVFDTDGQKGLSVPSSMEQEAFNEAMANIGSGLGTSISFAQSAGQQVAMDVTRGLLQGTSGYLAKKFRTVKVKLKAGYRVMLYAKQQ